LKRMSGKKGGTKKPSLGYKNGHKGVPPKKALGEFAGHFKKEKKGL